MNWRRLKPGDWVRIKETVTSGATISKGHIGKVLADEGYRSRAGSGVRVALKVGPNGEPVRYSQIGAIVVTNAGNLERLSDLEMLTLAVNE